MAGDETPRSLKDEKHDAFANEALVDPIHEETLHRGLKARQISMIAVGRNLYTRRL